jgi:pimeloyl-ACP methyl ester carboxylesterase
MRKQRLERCFLESSLPPEEFASRWVPEFFTEAASRELKEEMSAMVSDFHPLDFRLMAKSLADTDTTDLLPNIGVPTLLLWGDDDRRSPMKMPPTKPIVQKSQPIGFWRGRRVVITAPHGREANRYHSVYEPVVVDRGTRARPARY